VTPARARIAIPVPRARGPRARGSIKTTGSCARRTPGPLKLGLPTRRACCSRS